MKTLGLIAGGGSFPRLVAEGASRAGYRVVAFGLEGAMDDDLANAVDTVHVAPPNEFSKLLDLMKKEGVTDAVMAGAVNKLQLSKAAPADDLTRHAMKSLAARGDDTLLRAVAGILEQAGIAVRSAVFCAPDLVARAGIMTETHPSERQARDIEFGWSIAKEIGRLDIGQTVVVKARVVIAVESVEGTDAAIRRAGELAGPGCVVVKVSKPQQDLRFDMPAVGPDTMDSMAAAGAAVLAVEADRSILLHRDEMLRRAAAHEIVMLAR